MPNVAVFFGGSSCEAEISVITGMYAVNLLRGTRYHVLPVYLPPEGGMVYGTWRKVSEFAGRAAGIPVTLRCGALVREGRRRRFPVDVALNCCHGGMGEDGTLAALLAWNGIPSASPGVAGSAVAMDKWLTKLAARGLGLPVAPAVCIAERAFCADPEGACAQAAELGFPVVIKPARLGSSIGLTVVREAEGLRDALALAFTLDTRAVAERYFPEKRDVNCAACRLKGEIALSPCEEAFSGGELLSYEEKYERGSGRALPAQLPEGVAEEIGGMTRALYEALGLRGVVRADFLVVGARAYFNELNAVPGSLAGYLFDDTLTGIRAFFLDLLDEALREKPPAKQIIRTGILSQDIFSGAKGCKRRGNFV